MQYQTNTLAKTADSSRQSTIYSMSDRLRTEADCEPSPAKHQLNMLGISSSPLLLVETSLIFDFELVCIENKRHGIRRVEQMLCQFEMLCHVAGRKLRMRVGNTAENARPVLGLLRWLWQWSFGTFLWSDMQLLAFSPQPASKIILVRFHGSREWQLNDQWTCSGNNNVMYSSLRKGKFR